ncbi:MAG TPA: 2-succinyl-5-enolpyruvyl-6-hydroxy-3-cyclohexene-1-carboxylic-acid synthase [Flavobacteriaceae bacterium]|nr:2-succinyl-5-enolpyruvyl-6-hydroxy-3-cyclohexene-1-carboxylic-acid synthase [Flavobacteriaceae bacterium]
MNKIYSTIPLAQCIVELCASKGIFDIVISPGSRNAPLTIGFTNHLKINCFSIVDERSAAFFALGMAQQSKKPVAVVCTSGSALLNYYPAVAEAFYSDIPLVVISADRPEHLIDVGDGQTIRQPNVFQNHILYSANLKSDPVPYEKMISFFNKVEINKALNLSMEQRGPVHINAPFDEPLYNKSDELSVACKNIPHRNKVKMVSEMDLKTFLQNWNNSSRRMILVGVNSPEKIDLKHLEFFADDPSSLVFTETTSNLHHAAFFSSIDTIIAPIEKDKKADYYFKKLQPEFLLTFGGMVVSKKIKAFLRKYPPRYHYHIDSKKAYNTFFALTKHLVTEPNLFLKEAIAEMTPIKSNYRKFWEEVKIHRKQRRAKYLKEIPYSDFMVFDEIFKKIPSHRMLQIGNSSAIRYAQLFDLKNTISVFCNRGTSGIDGSVSTAIGAALASKKPTVLLTGDLSFFYDSNALWNNYIPENFKIIIVNNGGGGIFRILPGDKKADYFEKFFETAHDLTAVQLAEMFHFEYKKIVSEAELSPKLKAFFSKETKQVLEIFTPREINAEVLLNYFDYIGKD